MTSFLQMLARAPYEVRVEIRQGRRNPVLALSVRQSDRRFTVQEALQPSLIDNEHALEFVAMKRFDQLTKNLDREYLEGPICAACDRRSVSRVVCITEMLHSV